MDGLNWNYLFVDESGDLDFSETGSKYFILTGVLASRPFLFQSKFDAYRYDCLEGGLDVCYFHCNNNKKAVRHKLFEFIKESDGFKIHSVIVEKAKTGYSLQDELRFYPEMLGYLLGYVMREPNSKFIVITDTLPLQKKRKAIEKAIHQFLHKQLMSQVTYNVYHHSSSSHSGLQIADYCAWALFRKWEREDKSYYNMLSDHVSSEFDIFKSGDTYYYGEKTKGDILLPIESSVLDFEEFESGTK